MANRWGNNGNRERLYFGGLKLTADDEIKRCLLLGRKAMTNLDSILKSRDVTLPTKVCIVRAMVFPVVGLFVSGGQRIGASASASVQWIFRLSPLGLTGLISMLSKGLSRVFFSTFAVISTSFTTYLPVVYSISRNHCLYSLIKSNSSSTSFNNNLKVWNTVRITKMWHRDMKWAHAVGKIVLVDVAWCRVATNHEFVKNSKIKQVKHNKTRYAYA